MREKPTARMIIEPAAIAMARAARLLERWKTRATMPPKKTVDMVVWPLGKLGVFSITKAGQRSGRVRLKEIFKRVSRIQPPSTEPAKSRPEIGCFCQYRTATVARQAGIRKRASPS